MGVRMKLDPEKTYQKVERIAKVVKRNYGIDMASEEFQQALQRFRQSKGVIKKIGPNGKISNTEIRDTQGGFSIQAQRREISS